MRGRRRALSRAWIASKGRTVKVQGVRFSTLEAICRELDCQPGDLIEYVPDAEDTLRRTG